MSCLYKEAEAWSDPLHTALLLVWDPADVGVVWDSFLSFKEKVLELVPSTIVFYVYLKYGQIYIIFLFVKFAQMLVLPIRHSVLKRFYNFLNISGSVWGLVILLFLSFILFLGFLVVFINYFCSLLEFWNMLWVCVHKGNILFIIVWIYPSCKIIKYS